MKRSFLVLTALCVVTAAHAQMPAMPLPQEMKNLSGMIGEWEGTVKMTFPGQTEPMDMKSTVSVKQYGQYQETFYTMEMPGMKFSGHEFLWYDRTAKSYVSWNFDEQSPEPRKATGSLSEKKLVMTTDAQGGMVTRNTFEVKSKTEVTFLIEMKQEDKFVKLGEATYHRKG